MDQIITMLEGKIRAFALQTILSSVFPKGFSGDLLLFLRKD